MRPPQILPVKQWLASATLSALIAGGTAAAEPSPPRFEQDVWPIIAANCLACHGAEKPKANLDLRTTAAIIRGGESGQAIDPTDTDGSLLIQRVAAGEMPPGDKRKLSADEIAVLRDWVRAGAPADAPDVVPPLPPPVSDRDRQFWAFRPLAPSRPPAPADASRVRTPVDALLLERLAARGLTFSSPADPATLLRRVYFDLIGLPPSPGEVDAYLTDAAPDAYERMVDRLLASLHFGERWGRHWLDVAGYVDTVGFDVDGPLIITSEGKWLYRDYVIAAFNTDKPYDRFITEQVAGDELYDWRRVERFTPEVREALVATGFLRTARDLTHEDVGVIPQNFHGILHDTLEIVGTGLLGLTVNCARCHSHKFDPIPQEDYYRLTAFFTPAYNPLKWRPVIPLAADTRDRSLADVSPAELARFEAHNRQIDAHVDELSVKIAEVRRPHQSRLFEARQAALPEAIRADSKEAIETPAEKRNEVQKYLAGKFAAALTVKPEEVAAELNETEKAAVAGLEAQIAEARSQRAKWGKIQALFDDGPPPPTHLLVRGDYEAPGDEVQPGFLRVLCRSEIETVASIVPPAEGTSGRRLALARWLTEPGTRAASLLARVQVNRIWQHLFGQGLVSTPDNFGAQGQPPTHPELLEWLAAEYMANGWRLKPLVKLLVMSSAYRQDSRREPAEKAADPAEIDPANDLLWKMRLRQLEAEVVRDTMLAASGQLNRAAGGPPVPIETRMDGKVVVAVSKLTNPAEACRRSVYLLARRAYTLSLLAVFDQPPVATNCLHRDASAVPLQSLTMLNDEFVAEQAGAMADHIVCTASAAPRERIALAFLLALGRRPHESELTWCEESLARQAQHFEAQASESSAADKSAEAAARMALVQLCRMLFNTSEFLYAE
jgi:mono/diheme cytochrome c family protein